jgi:hypothetical protein
MREERERGERREREERKSCLSKLRCCKEEMRESKTL